MFYSGILGAVLCLVGGWTPPLSYDTEHFRFRYVEAARKDAEALARRAEAIRQRIVADLGRAPTVPTTVIVVARREEFQRAQPSGRRFPRWVAGVAYPRRSLIILGPAPAGERLPAREVLFAHEFSHVALSHAVGHRRLPVWFVEGFADLQAMAPHLGSWQSWSGTGARSLRELHRNLGSDSRKASQSYQQSYDFVRFLREQGGGVAFRQLIRRLAQGQNFDRALSSTYHLSQDELEEKWRQHWNWQHVLVPMITSGLFLWVLAALLLVWGFLRKRRERRAAIEAMDGPERGDELPEAPLREPEGPPAREALPLINMGVLLVATLLVVTLTAIFASIWPYTRLWVLAAPAVLITVIALRWASK